MQFLATLAFLITAIQAAPASNAVAPDLYLGSCPGQGRSPQCCSLGVVGTLDLLNVDCMPPPIASKCVGTPGFVDACHTIGKEAQCCDLPLLGLLGVAAACHPPV